MTVTILKPLAGLFNDAETRQSARQAVQTGRSWWALRCAWIDDWIHEWDPDPGSPNKHVDWTRIPKRGRQALRLYCPNGKFAQLGDTSDASGKLFQFKVGQRNFAIGIGGATEIEHRQTVSHVIGMLHGLNGECVLYAWEPIPPPEIPIDAPKPPNEQEWIAKSAAPGLYEQAVARWQIDIADYERSPSFKAFEKRFKAWQQNAGGQLVGPLEDNVYQMAYQQVGRISADHLGLEDGEGR